MGYATVMSECCGCHKVMTYNPHKVPSMRVNGVREPVCRTCIETANPKRIKAGLEPFVIQPGAYDAINEMEL